MENGTERFDSGRNLKIYTIRKKNPPYKPTVPCTSGTLPHVLMLHYTAPAPRPRQMLVVLSAGEDHYKDQEPNPPKSPLARDAKIPETLKVKVTPLSCAKYKPTKK